MKRGLNSCICEKVEHRHGAMVLILAGSDLMEFDEQDRKLVDSEKKKR